MASKMRYEIMSRLLVHLAIVSMPISILRDDELKAAVRMIPATEKPELIACLYKVLAELEGKAA